MTDEKIYRASINFYSNDKDDLVTVMTEVSDELGENDPIPSAYTSMQVMAMQLMSSAVPMELDESRMQEVLSSNESNEDRARALLSSITPADRAAAEIAE